MSSHRRKHHRCWFRAKSSTRSRIQNGCAREEETREHKQCAGERGPLAGDQHGTFRQSIRENRPQDHRWQEHHKKRKSIAGNRQSHSVRTPTDIDHRRVKWDSLSRSSQSRTRQSTPSSAAYDSLLVGCTPNDALSIPCLSNQPSAQQKIATRDVRRLKISKGEDRSVSQVLDFCIRGEGFFFPPYL